MSAFNKLNQILGQEMSPEEAKDAFLRNIEDPTYGTVKAFLETNIDQRTPKELTEEINKKRLVLDRTKADDEPFSKPKRVLDNSSGSNDNSDPAKQSQKLESLTLPSVVRLNESGFI